MIYRKFIATILAASIAITGFTAAPAQADSNDYVKVIAGIAALAIIGSAIADKDDDDHKVSRKHYNTYNYYGEPHYKKKYKKSHKRKNKHYSKKHKKSYYGHKKYNHKKSYKKYGHKKSHYGQGYKKSRGGHNTYGYRK